MVTRKAKLGKKIDREIISTLKADYKWVDVQELKTDIKNNPDNYTYWLKVALDKIESKKII